MRPNGPGPRAFPILPLMLTALALLAAIDGGRGRPARAYETETTHPLLMNRSVDLASSGLCSPAYAEIGFYRGELVQAVRDEDDTPRFDNHFYDPTTGLGLPR